MIQAIYAVTLSLDDVPDLVKEEPAEAATRVDTAIDALHDVIRDIRHFIFGLQPLLLDSGSLMDGFNVLADELRRNTTTEIHVRGDEPPDLPLAMVADLLAIAREALANVARHADAGHATITVSGADGAVRLEIADDGRGFAADADLSHGHHGLANMRTRAAALAEPWRWRAEPAKGPVSSWSFPGRELARRNPVAADASQRPLRLLVVDDHEVVRQGLVALLDRREGFEVVAQAGTVAESIDAAARYEPDLVIMDVRLPDGSGIEACRDIRSARPETRVIMLTSYPDEEAVLSAIIAGASGYLLKQIRGRDLVTALEAVGRGESLLDSAVTEKVLERVRRMASGAEADELSDLTAQERKILLLVAEGKTNKEIASEVFLSDKTVKNYVSSILSKLNLQRRAQAAAFVAKHHLAPPDES